MVTPLPEEPAGCGEPRFFGIFRMLHEMDLPHTRVAPIYEGPFASTYDALSATYDWDTEFYLARLRDEPERILELGCGPGRLTLRFARAGHSVVGLDRSAGMLELCRRRLSREEPALGERVRLTRGDMRTLDLDTTFSVVVLPANNLSLLLEREEQLAALRCARRHLPPGGLLLLDSVVADHAALTRQNDDLSAVPFERTDARQFLISAHRWYEDEQVQVMNQYTEIVRPDGVTDRWLGWWVKSVLSDETVSGLLADAGFEVVERETRQLTDDRRTVWMLACRAV